MSEHYDFKKEWPKIKKRLLDMSQEAKVLAKKGEEELVKFSKKSKLQIDATSLNLKKEKLFYQIGREYARYQKSGKKTAKMIKFLEELAAVEKQERVLKRKMKAPAKKN